MDQKTGRRAWLFHPRRHEWRTHFQWKDLMIVGRTPIGRATVRLLNMNAEDDLEIRQALKTLGRFPPLETVRPTR